MKNEKSVLKSLFVFCMVGIIISCEQQSVDPPLKLDEVFVPEGYHQIDNPSIDALSRLDEFRLNNPNDQYYYLELENKNVKSKKDWLFPQKELKIEYVDNEGTTRLNENPKILGVIVKKIKGDYRTEEFMIIDEQPKPHDGFKALYNYVAENLKYPELAKKERIEVKVFVQFIVNNDGKLINVKAIKGIGGGCDEEAVRVLKEAPRWIPGKVVDMPVKVKMILPITYRLSPPQETSGNIEETVLE